VRHGALVETTEYIDVAVRARELGCRVPSGVALLPGNFATATGSGEFRFHPAVPEVRSAWRLVGITDSGPYQKSRSADGSVQRSGDESVPLVVFFGLSSDAMTVLPALGMVATVLTADPNSATAREAVFDAVVERPNRRGCVCLKCRGFASDIIDLVDPVQKAREDR